MPSARRLGLYPSPSGLDTHHWLSAPVAQRPGVKAVDRLHEFHHVAGGHADHAGIRHLSAFELARGVKRAPVARCVQRAELSILPYFVVWTGLSWIRWLSARAGKLRLLSPKEPLEFVQLLPPCGRISAGRSAG